MFSSTELSAQSSSDSAKYKCAWYQARVINSYILSAGGFFFIIIGGKLDC